MATASPPGPIERPGLQTPAAAPMPSAAELQAASSPSDDDLLLYGDQDDAQSFIQPAISPAATRLSSAKTPADEKARAILDHDAVGPGAVGGPFAAAQPGSAGRAARPFPTPWQAGPKEFVVRDREGSAAAAAAATGIAGASGPARNSRASSVGTDALKRLSKALPSISIPSSLLPNMSAASFFATLSQKMDSPSAVPSPSTATTPALSAQKPWPLHRAAPPLKSAPLPSAARFAATPPPPRPSLSRPPSVGSRRSLALRRSTSDDSLLYHSLSRVSSFGDDDRFGKVRDQVNSRFKAIKDSFPDVPTFKMPQLPNLFPTPSKTNLSASDVPRAGSKAADPASLLDHVLETLTGDVVVLGGYRGSVLRDARPPFRQVWIPVKVGLNIRKVNMEVGLDPEDEAQVEKTMFPSGMLQNIGPVDIAKRLFKKLRECDNARRGKLRVHDYGYDWRLSPHLLSRRLIEFLEGLPCNRAGTPRPDSGAVVIAHSLGGLITRHAVNARPELFAGVVYAGTPQKCVNILGPFRNGDAVLLNEKVLTAQVNFSLRTSFAFLPDDGFCFFNKETGEEYPVDFYDVDDWVKYRWSPCVADPALPPYHRRASTLGSLLDLPASLSSSLPLRSRSGSESNSKKAVYSPSPASTAPRPYAALGFADAFTDPAKERDRTTLAPQMDFSPSSPSFGPSPDRSGGGSVHAIANNPARESSPPPPQQQQDEHRAKALTYLARTLAETKRFRAETAHMPAHTAANAYPPIAIIYGKDIPTVWAARVACRAAIACADAYDDLAFRSGDGVVLAREAMPPPGYHLARGGRACSDRGHVTLLGDLAAVAKALDAVVKGRRKGIGLGPDAFVGRQ